MAGQAERTLRPEDEIAHYRVVSPLGAGGMGEVYLAQDRTLERNVALKILPPDLVKSEDRVRRFELEAKSASQLSHPNIVTIYEIGQAGGALAGEPRLGPGALHLDGARERQDARRAHPRGQGRPAHAARLPRPGRGGAREGARRRDRAPRPQAREHHGVRGRLHQGPRLRPRQAHREARGRARHLRGPDPGRRRQRGGQRDRDGRVHVARAGGGAGRRPPVRHLLVRLHPLRGGHPEEALRGRDRHRDDAQDPQREAGPRGGDQRQGPGRAAAADQALPREERRPARAVDQGPGDRAARDRGGVRLAVRLGELREPRLGGVAGQGGAPGVAAPRRGGARRRCRPRRRLVGPAARCPGEHGPRPVPEHADVHADEPRRPPRRGALARRPLPRVPGGVGGTGEPAREAGGDGKRRRGAAGEGRGPREPGLLPGRELPLLPHPQARQPELPDALPDPLARRELPGSAPSTWTRG